MGDLAAVLLTHEHADHVRSLPNVVRAGVPVLATRGTALAAGVPTRVWEDVTIGRATAVGRLAVTPIGVSHDAAEPCGYHIQANGTAITVITDIGRADEAIDGYIADSDLVVLEANHDDAMLRHGPYPLHLKRRVLSDVGHLSNDDCGRTLARALTGATRPRTIWLAHLSHVNNRPRLAVQTVARILTERGMVHPIVPLARYGHETVWRSDEAPSFALQLALPLG